VAHGIQLPNHDSVGAEYRAAERLAEGIL
jgi:hypothetical protein